MTDQIQTPKLNKESSRNNRSIYEKDGKAILHFAIANDITYNGRFYLSLADIGWTTYTPRFTINGETRNVT